MRFFNRFRYWWQENWLDLWATVVLVAFFLATIAIIPVNRYWKHFGLPDCLRAAAAFRMSTPERRNSCSGARANGASESSFHGCSKSGNWQGWRKWDLLSSLFAELWCLMLHLYVYRMVVYVHDLCENLVLKFSYKFAQEVAILLLGGSGETVNIARSPAIFGNERRRKRTRLCSWWLRNWACTSRGC